MNQALVKLASRIRRELKELKRVEQRVQEAWRRSQVSSDDYYLDAVALNLHGLYGGLERLFELIATTVDGARPEGPNWHQDLLRRMQSEVPGVRPAVISEEVGIRLDAYRGFRHIVRNVYTFTLEPAKLQQLVADAPSIFSQVDRELSAFADFLEGRAQDSIA